MPLTGPQKEKFRVALLAAFNRSSLTQMLGFKLDITLDNIVNTNQPLNDVIFDLINIADQENWHVDLLKSAREANPNNQILRDFAVEMDLANRQNEVNIEPAPKLNPSAYFANAIEVQDYLLAFLDATRINGVVKILLFIERAGYNYDKTAFRSIRNTISSPVALELMSHSIIGSTESLISTIETTTNSFSAWGNIANVNVDAKNHEKLLNNRNNLENINWLEQGMKASKSVCRIKISNGEMGTGFLLEGGYLLTNNHVISTPEQANKAIVEFNYEELINGNAATVYQYKLDGATMKTSELLDYTYIKVEPTNIQVLNTASKPLSEWGFLDLNRFDDPQAGSPATIIQHPNGGRKQIVFRDNDILGSREPYLFYKADTLKGSSGSPVFDFEWKVIALHHAGREKVQINENGTKQSANEGILIKHIIQDLNL